MDKAEQGPTEHSGPGSKFEERNIASLRPGARLSMTAQAFTTISFLNKSRVVLSSSLIICWKDGGEARNLFILLFGFLFGVWRICMCVCVFNSWGTRLLGATCVPEIQTPKQHPLRKKLVACTTVPEVELDIITR